MLDDKINTSSSIKIHDHLWAATLFKFIPEEIKPNHITVFRLLATPWVLLLILQENYTWAIPAFLVVALSDSVDGSLARIRNQITDWGKIWDPIADKILIGSVIYIFVMKFLDFYLGLFIIFIEVAFILFGWYRLSQGHSVEANLMGKIKMLLQVIGVLILLIGVNTGLPHLLPFSEVTFYLAIVFAVLSLLTHGV